MPNGQSYLENGFPESDNNTAERAIKPVAIGRDGGKAMAIAFTPIKTAKLNGVVSQAWLTLGLAKIADHTMKRVDKLLLWRYAAQAA